MLKSLQVIETERVSHLCRLIQWRGAVSIRSPQLLLDMARRRQSHTGGRATIGRDDDDGTRTATWKMSLGPVSLRITCKWARWKERIQG